MQWIGRKQPTAQAPAAGRDQGFDNIRGLLIICVVFGHFVEQSAPFPGRLMLYQTIYSFHMPAFLFLFGYFCRYAPRRIVSGWVIPYFLFQTAYILFRRTILGADAALQFTTPYWLLWYLPVCVFYQLLIPLYDTNSRKQKILTLAVCALLALLVGYDETIGYYATLSRFFVFQPWFVLGFYLRRSKRLKSIAFPSRVQWPQAVCIAACVCISVIGIFLLRITGAMLYGSYSYEELSYSAGIRAFSMFAAASWIAFFVYIVRTLLNRKIVLLTTLGQNTLPVFLLHGFIVRAIPHYAPGLLDSPWRVIIITAVTVLLLGNPFLGKCFRKLINPAENPQPRL